MKSRISRAFVASFGIALASSGCGGNQAHTTPAASPQTSEKKNAATPRAAESVDESFRASAPIAEPMAPFAVPEPRELSLDNGMRILLIERHDLPVVALQMLVPHGTDDAPARLGSFAMQTILRSRRDDVGRSARDRFDELAVGANTWGTLDGVGAGMSCARDKLAPALAILAEALTSPKIDAKDTEIVRGELLATLESDKSSLSTAQQWAISESLYPAGHPYRGVTRDRFSDLRAVTKTNIERFLKSHLTPNGMTAIVAGDVTASEIENLFRTTWGSWKGSPTFRPPAPAAAPRPDAKTGRVFLLDRPGASQTHVAIVAPSIARASADYVPAMVYDRILGGTVSSRLFRNLREQKGLTYGVWSSITTHHGPGEFTAGGAVVKDKAGIAIQEIFKEMDRLATEPVGESELTEAIEGLVRQLPARFETLGVGLWSYSDAPVYGLPPDELRTRAERFAKVTPEDVMRIGKTYFDRGALRVVVTGDARVVRKDLEALGLGPVQMLPDSVDPRARH